MSSSQDVLFSWTDVLGGTGHSVGAIHGQKTQNNIRGWSVNSRTSKVWLTIESIALCRSLAGLIQTHSDRPATSLKSDGLFAYPAYVMWLTYTEGK